jgi:hypothetical protein
MLRRAAWVLIASLLLTACLPFSSSAGADHTGAPSSEVAVQASLTVSQPTAAIPPSPTTAPVSPTLQPTASSTPLSSPTDTLEPTATASPLPTLPPLPSLPAPTPLVTPVPQPAAGSDVIEIALPGALSEILSPLTGYGYAVPGYERLAHLVLVGETGDTLASQRLGLYTPYTWAYFYWTVPYQITGLAELARLSIYTQDEFGRMTALNSVHVILQSEGAQVINPGSDLEERVLVDSPAAKTRVGGGILKLHGKMRPFDSLPLQVQLIDQQGNVLGQVLVPISPTPLDDYVPFQASVPYTVQGLTEALLQISQADDRIPGMMYLYSQELYLAP